MVEQKVAAWINNAWQPGDVSRTEYNAFGDLVRSGINGAWQQENKYDAAGRMWASNSGDGIWKYFGYDKNGNQTIAIISAGADLGGKTFNQARALIGDANVNATYTVYDGRNLAVRIIEEGREYVESDTGNSVIAALTTYRTYNAFGDVASETNTADAKITYIYNTMGRMIRSEGPAVKITLESGATKWVKPAEDFYYDVAGRLVAKRDANGSYAAGGANAASAVSKLADKGNLTRLTLLAGTGYGGSQALVTEEIRADGGRTRTGYDIHGDARVVNVLFDGNGSSSGDIWLETDQTFDKLGRLIERRELRQKYSAGTQALYTTDDFFDSYAYDLLGQQIRHGNSHYSTYDTGTGRYLNGNIETTDYDLQGRVVSTRAFGGDVTTYAYSWDIAIAAGGIGYTAPGGWSKVTTYANSKTLTEKTDIFGRATYKKDLGDHETSYTYDLAGRLTKSQIGSTSYNYEYYNTGQVHKAFTTAPNWTYYTSASGSGSTATKQDFSSTATQSAVYTYDEAGNRLTEYGELKSGGTTVVWKDHTATYDALGRLTSDTMRPTSVQPKASVVFGYDANGNVMMKSSTYRYMNAEGGFNTGDVTRTAWYRYDSMNRVVINNGDLSGGQIILGTPVSKDFVGDPSQAITYNKAGQRTSVSNNLYYEHYLQPASVQPYGDFGGGLVTYTAAETERYEYDGAGRLSKINVAGHALSEYAYMVAGIDAATRNEPTPPAQDFVVSTGEVRRAAFSYDALGRQTGQNTYGSDGTTVVHNASTNYNSENGRIEATFISTKKDDGKTYTQSVTNYYGSGSSYALGAVTSSTGSNSVNGQSATSSTTTNTFEWWDGAVQKTIQYVEDSKNWTTTFNYNGLGQLINAHIADGQPRDVYFTLDEVGQIIRRDETRSSSAPAAQTGSPHELWYRLGDREIGYVGNNGGTNPTLLTSLAQQQAAGGPGTFRGGSTNPQSSIGFAQALDPINLHEQGSVAGSWTVKAGDTLQSIAQKLYGDASLWYKIAEVNGLSSGSSLIAGQQLTLPSGVLRNTYTADSFRPYDPAQAIGDLSPSTPKPPKKNNCGMFGQILLAAIAIGISVWLGPEMIGFFQGAFASSVVGGVVGGVLTGAAGSIVSQTVGVISGIQDSFSWKSVGLAAIAGGIGGGLQGTGLFGETVGKSFTPGKIGIQSGLVDAAVRGAAQNAITQGIAVATRLQSNFDWAGVAAGGVGAGVGHWVGGGLPSLRDNASLSNIGRQFGTSAATQLASAATRSAIKGESFADNFVAALPDVIGGTLGSLVASEIAGRGHADIVESIDPPTVQPPANINGGQVSKNGYIVVTPRRSSIFDYVDYFPQITAILISFDIQRGGIEYAANRQHQRIVRNLADQYKATISSGLLPQGPLTADGLTPQPVGSMEVAASLIELRGWRARAYEIYKGGYVENGIHTSYSESYYKDIVRGYDLNEALIHRWNSIADDEVNKLLFVAVGAPALVAGSAVAAPAAGAYAVSLGGGGMAYYGTSFAVGSLTSGGFEYAKNEVFGLEHTTGGYVGSMLSGGIGGTGLKVLGAGGTPALVNDTLTGGVLSGGGEAFGQYINLKLGNISNIDEESIVISSFIGAASSGGVGDVRINGLNAGRNSSLSIYKGLQTRMSNGSISQFGMRYGIMGGIAEGIKGVGQGAADSIYSGIYEDANR
ncbi:LysM peptidoglycan-binding domain-containing protein [Altererythrobacter sp. CC-YST694]|uniref:LysM peptidoglycan-binding domain-containing protein n=1 Tax=Altererythrobacter sp. CC-YST694 TaxID=2755038 RepID=UPI001D004048|nr:LysM peptidoglycan-binding domain-containing protein [Altererythrobacter sp. CC-YST694]MCB5425960.1 LysM peptidoglycan-binding domain-containing protein [Altererythrobacter sp. CC-YST694]